jgi:hypothetical protein
MDQRITRLDDRAVFRILSAVTENLREELPVTETKAIGTADDARAAVAALIESTDGKKVDSTSITFDGPRAARAARELLNAMLNDPDTQPQVVSELANPPSDAQKSPELALAGAIILGSLITWMQTTMDIGINRHKDGTLDYSFRLKKKGSGDKLISNVTKTISSLIGL